MLVTASWGGEEVAVEVDAECRSVDGLKRRLQEALPELDVEAVRLEVSGRLSTTRNCREGSFIDISATQAALAAAALREEGLAVDFNGFCCAAKQGNLRVCRLYVEAVVVWPSGVDTPLHIAVRFDAGFDKEVKSNIGTTPLHLAISEQNMELVTLLLDVAGPMCVPNDRPLSGLPWHPSAGCHSSQPYSSICV